MSSLKKLLLLLVCSASGAVVPTQALWACPSCYGAVDSPMMDGMNMAILAMLGITGFVLVAISSFFIMMRRRMKNTRTIPPDQAFVNDKGILRWNNS